LTELAPGVGALELIPGNPDELGRLAARLSVFGEGMSEAATTLADVEAVGWTGPAADAFQGLVGDQPAKYRAAGSSFEQAVSAIRSYAAVLRHAQADAGRAVAMFEAATRESEQWQRERTAHDADVRSARAAGDPPPSGPAPPATNPAAAGLAASHTLLADARASVRAQGQIAATALAAAAEAAPSEPGLLDRTIGGIGDFVGGIGEELSAAWSATGAALSDAAGFIVDGFERYGASVLKIVAGALVVAVGVQVVIVGVGMAGAGVVLDATGVGAVVGVPLNLGGVAVAGGGVILIIGGGALLMQGMSDLGDDINESRGSEESSSGSDAAQETQEKVDDILQDAKQGKVKDSDQRIKDGGNDAAARDFDELADGLPVDSYPNGARVVYRPDGTTVTYYPQSSGGVPTVRIDRPGNPVPIKVRYP
jgi:hypothetical protein